MVPVPRMGHSRDMPSPQRVVRYVGGGVVLCLLTLGWMGLRGTWRDAPSLTDLVVACVLVLLVWVVVVVVIEIVVTSRDRR